MSPKEEERLIKEIKEKKREYEKLRTVLRKCFEDARKLDLIGLDHGELNNLRKHVIVKPNLKFRYRKVQCWNVLVICVGVDGDNRGC